MLGCMDIPGVDGIPHGRQIPVDPLNKSAGFVNVTCGTAPYVCKSGGSVSLWDSKFKDPADAKAYPYGPQSDDWSVKNGAKAGEGVEMFGPEQLPIKKTLVDEFAVFVRTTAVCFTMSSGALSLPSHPGIGAQNKYYTSTPTASTPNHLFAQSCTSCGQIGNELYSTVGGKTQMYPQLTIYDNLRLNNVSFGLYMVSTPPLADVASRCAAASPDGSRCAAAEQHRRAELAQGVPHAR